MKLSIIIPVFNVEDTLNRCVESILKQNYEDMEIILVNDGSPDRCPMICEQWANKDQRIIVIHKKNGGLSDARNAGIDIATGSHITFVDSDDYVDDETFKQLMGIIYKHPEYDILEYGIRFIKKTGESYLSFKDKTYNAYQYWHKGEAYAHSYAWNKIYRRDLFNEVRFPVGKVFEDLWTLPLLTAKAKVIATTSKGCYNYLWNQNGITANANGTQLKMLLDAHIKLMEDPTIRMTDNDSYYMRVVNIQMDVYEMLGEIPAIPLKKIKDFKLPTSTLKLKAIALNLLGVNNLCKVNKAIHRLTKCHR